MRLVTKIAFFILFLVILVEPHFITGHVFSLPEEFAESVASLLVFGLAYGVYALNRRDAKRKEEQVRQLEREGRISQEKLIDAFKYIGVVNRRLPLLQTLTSDLLANEKGNDRARKDVFQRLLALAVTSVAKAEWGNVQIRGERARTDGEGIHVCVAAFPTAQNQRFQQRTPAHAGAKEKHPRDRGAVRNPNHRPRDPSAGVSRVSEDKEF